MKKKISPKIVSLIFSILVICFAVSFYIFAAWTEPTEAPPGGNVDAPINVGADLQYKSGGLGVGGLSVDFYTYLATDGGNVGIGTTSPQSSQDGRTIKLDVTENIVAKDVYLDNPKSGSPRWASEVGGAKTWQSTWISLPAGTGVNLTHTLGTKDMIITILLSSSSDGSNPWVYEGMASCCGDGLTVMNITSTGLRVQAVGGNSFMKPATNGTADLTYTVWVKVLAMAIE